MLSLSKPAVILVRPCNRIQRKFYWHKLGSDLHGSVKRGISNSGTVLLTLQTNTIMLSQVTGPQGFCKKTWRDYDQGHRIQMLLSSFVNSLSPSSSHVDGKTSRFELCFANCQVWGFLPYCNPWRSHIEYSWYFLSKLLTRTPNKALFFPWSHLSLSAAQSKLAPDSSRKECLIPIVGILLLPWS